MAESVLKEIFPLFEENSTRITRKNLALVHNKKSSEEIAKESKVNPEVLKIVLEELNSTDKVSRVDLLKSILYKSNDEVIKKATIQELVRLKTKDLRSILANYLKENRVNTPSKVEAIRALGRESIKKYLERRS